MDPSIPKNIQKILAENDENQKITTEIIQKCEEVNEIWDINLKINSLRNLTINDTNLFEITQSLHELYHIKEKLEANLN